MGSGAIQSWPPVESSANLEILSQCSLGFQISNRRAQSPTSNESAVGMDDDIISGTGELLVNFSLMSDATAFSAKEHGGTHGFSQLSMSSRVKYLFIRRAVRLILHVRLRTRALSVHTSTHLLVLVSARCGKRNAERVSPPCSSSSVSQRQHLGRVVWAG